MMERAVADPDPWHGLTSFMRGANEMQAADQGLKELLVGTAQRHAAGALRDDVFASDLPIVQLLIGGVIEASRHVDSLCTSVPPSSSRS